MRPTKPSASILIPGVLILGLAALSGQNNLTFEVASVKPAAPPAADGRFFVGIGGGPGTPDPGQIRSNNVTLKMLLTNAYDVQPYQVTGPAWIDTERYDIIAKVPLATTKDQARMMWQNLLAERFGVVFHRESKEFKVDELVVSKGGHKLKESEASPNATAQPGPPQPGPPKLDKNGVPQLTAPGLIAMMTMSPSGLTSHAAAKAQPVSQLVTMLSNQLGRPVVDKTGLTGKYDFTLEFKPDVNALPMPLPPGASPGAAFGDNPSEPGSNLAAAVQQQLGLRLVSGKGQLDVLVIDKANKTPTDN